MSFPIGVALKIRRILLIPRAWLIQYFVIHGWPVRRPWMVHRCSSVAHLSLLPFPPPTAHCPPTPRPETIPQSSPAKKMPLPDPRTRKDTPADTSRPSRSPAPPPETSSRSADN